LKAGTLSRDEQALWRRVAKVARRGKDTHLTTVKHAAGRKDRISRQPLRGSPSLLAVARARGSSGLLCGCSPIVIKRQPNGDIDICILIDCSNDPKTAGFRCHYWCSTLVAPPVVGIARQRSQPSRMRQLELRRISAKAKSGARP
jgi:hypothetical protein